jgi:hypothetical protein
MAFSQMDVVASLGALLRWNRFFLAVHVCAARRGAAKDGALSFAADCDGEQATGRSAKVRDLLATILTFDDPELLRNSES